MEKVRILFRNDEGEAFVVRAELPYEHTRAHVYTGAYGCTIDIEEDYPLSDLLDHSALGKDMDCAIRLMIEDGRYIQAIRLLRSVANCGLKEAKEAVDKIRSSL